MISAWVGAPQNWPVDKFFNPEYQSFKDVSMVNSKNIFDIPLPNNILNSFLNLFISLTELEGNNCG